MKKSYQNIELEILFIATEDIVRTSPTDNVENMPEFPEDPPNFG